MIPLLNALGGSIKDVRSQKGRGLSSADMEEGVLQMWTSTLFGARSFGFFEIYGVSARAGEGGLSQYGHFSDKRVNFPRFCADVLYGRPLILIGTRTC